MLSTCSCIVYKCTNVKVLSTIFDLHYVHVCDYYNVYILYITLLCHFTTRTCHVSYCFLITQYSEETTVYVTNIPFNANEEQLQKIFQEVRDTCVGITYRRLHVHHHYRLEKLKKFDWSETDRADQKDLLISNIAVRYNISMCMYMYMLLTHRFSIFTIITFFSCSFRRACSSNMHYLLVSFVFYTCIGITRCCCDEA